MILRLDAALPPAIVTWCSTADSTSAPLASSSCRRSISSRASDCSPSFDQSDKGARKPGPARPVSTGSRPGRRGFDGQLHSRGLGLPGNGDSHGDLTEVCSSIHYPQLHACIQARELQVQGRHQDNMWRKQTTRCRQRLQSFDRRSPANIGSRRAKISLFVFPDVPAGAAAMSTAESRANGSSRILRSPVRSGS